MKTMNNKSSKSALNSFASQEAPAFAGNNFKMSKGIRKQLFHKCVEKYVSHDGCYSIKSILPEDVYPWNVENLMEQWLDENCSNGHFSRWTNFGCGLMADAEDFIEDLWRAYEEYGFLKG